MSKGRVKRGTAICCDCGMDTMPKGKQPGTFEQFVCRDEVWSAAGMTPGKIVANQLVGGGFLCVGCIETRLGRRLTIDDLSPITLSELIGSPWLTERLRSRVLYRTKAEEEAAKLAPPLKLRVEFQPEGLMARFTEPETDTAS